MHLMIGNKSTYYFYKNTCLLLAKLFIQNPLTFYLICNHSNIQLMRNTQAKRDSCYHPILMNWQVLMKRKRQYIYMCVSIQDSICLINILHFRRWLIDMCYSQWTFFCSRMQLLVSRTQIAYFVTGLDKSKSSVNECIAVVTRWRGDYGSKKQLLFPANYVEEMDTHNDNSDSAPLGVLQEGAIDIQGCLIGQLPDCLPSCLPACLPQCLPVCLSVCLPIFFFYTDHTIQLHKPPSFKKCILFVHFISYVACMILTLH